MSLSFFYAISAFGAESYHVTDEVKIYMHRGPSNQYKIKARVNSGTPLTLLARNNETKYVQVRTDKGVQGWIDGRYLKVGKSVKARLPEVEKELIASKKIQVEQASKIETLTAELQRVNQLRKGELGKINDSRAKSTAQLAQLENQIVRLQAEIDGMDDKNLMGWFLHGGAVAIIGIILGLMIPKLPKRRRRTDEWL
ncbi:TIGR04211 family SH3 domain-containing protein [Motiliproteus sp. MSK22-1]|uniref:TIGR04211 family SH3 domain-containing protein n=1 Tax=Motiliproteus sp. MSK22-1 TaxID=1897630 RepID=UPI00130115B0|nr:TIGR04211 family SH3 domain-containing protein [Motiliproteus sp. MSK22-1]